MVTCDKSYEFDRKFTTVVNKHTPKKKNGFVVTKSPILIKL